MIAQTLTADAPKTGNEVVDKLVSVIYAISAVLTALSFVLPILLAKIASMRRDVEKITGAARSVVAGVIDAQADAKDALAKRFPDMPMRDVEAAAAEVHRAVEERIRHTSNAAGTEETLKPLVRETKSAMRAVDENGVAKP